MSRALRQFPNIRKPECLEHPSLSRKPLNVLEEKVLCTTHGCESADASCVIQDGIALWLTALPTGIMIAKRFSAETPFFKSPMPREKRPGAIERRLAARVENRFRTGDYDFD